MGIHNGTLGLGNHVTHKDGGGSKIGSEAYISKCLCQKGMFWVIVSERALQTGELTSVIVWSICFDHGKKND